MRVFTLKIEQQLRGVGQILRARQHWGHDRELLLLVVLGVRVDRRGKSRLLGWPMHMLLRRVGKGAAARCSRDRWVGSLEG